MDDRKKHGARYPWAQWFKSGRVKIYRGRDYHCRSDSMELSARLAASPAKLNYILHIEGAADGSWLEITAIPRAPKGKRMLPDVPVQGNDGELTTRAHMSRTP